MAREQLKEPGEERVVKGMCNACSLGCERDIYIRDGKIIRHVPKKEHKFAEFMGGICHTPIEAIIKGWVYSEERLLSPFQRVDGKWRQVSWGEALSFISDKLNNIKSRYGAQSLAVYCGPPVFNTQTDRVARRFCDVFGTPNFASSESFCYFGRLIGDSLTLGAYLNPTFYGTKCYMAWGRASIKTHAPPAVERAILSRLRQPGTKLLVVDPRLTPVAKVADIHAQLRPGTDCALALSLLNVIINESLYDKEFVKNWTVGFDRLVEHVKQYTPEKVEKITWVPADIIRNLAITYATTKPATIDHGPCCESTNATHASRAIAIMVAITGNWDIPGGNNYVKTPKLTDLRVKEKMHPEEAVGAEYPLYSKYVFTPQTIATPWIDAMVTGRPYPVKALILQASNPIMTWPNTSKVRKGFENLDLLVAIELFMTESAKLAHIILPATTSFERKTLKAYNDLGLPLISLANQAIDPLGNSWPDWKIWVELARKMGYGEYFPWQSDEELFRSLLEPTGISLEQLRENPGGIFYASKEFKRYLKEGFNTPSGKVEIYSKVLEEYGYDPLPTYYEPAESPISRPDLADKYPLILMTGVRADPYHHARGRNIPKLRKRLPGPLVEINTQTANELSITNGGEVIVESPRGSIKLKAWVSAEILPKVVSITHGWAEANANILTDDGNLDPVTGMPGLRSLLCRVVRA